MLLVEVAIKIFRQIHLYVSHRKKLVKWFWLISIDMACLSLLSMKCTAISWIFFTLGRRMYPEIQYRERAFLLILDRIWRN